MTDIDKHVADARAHLAEAKHWGYSPDPWAEAIVYLADSIFDMGSKIHELARGLNVRG